MVDALLDSSILVDLLRKLTRAEQWLVGQTNLGISRGVWLEVLDGVLNKVEQQRTIRLLRDFELVEMTTTDMDWATKMLLHYRLSHGVGMMDCLIAAPAYRLQLPLFTQNLKHFAPLLGPLAQKPC